jgi:sugar phosphate isomerase/epimerase
MELAPPDLVAVAAQAGYDSVGLRFIPVAGQTLPPFDVAEVERRLRDTGVRVLDLEVFRIAPETRVGDFEPALAVAQRLGASELLAHGADADFARLTDRFGALCDLAARYRLTVNLEPMPWVEVSNVAKAKRILEHTKGSLLVDAIHFFRAGDRFSEIPQGLRYMQLCDAPAQAPRDMQEIIRQARADRLFPGEGGLDLQGLMRALPPELPISVEIPYAKPMSPLERAQRALAATRKLLACASPS